jgi:hypothetical protein
LFLFYSGIRARFSATTGKGCGGGLSACLAARGAIMVARVSTVAFQGIEGVPVDVQVMVAPGKVGMQMLRRINCRNGLLVVRGSFQSF